MATTWNEGLEEVALKLEAVVTRFQTELSLAIGNENRHAQELLSIMCTQIRMTQQELLEPTKGAIRALIQHGLGIQDRRTEAVSLIVGDPSAQKMYAMDYSTASRMPCGPTGIESHLPPTYMNPFLAEGHIIDASHAHS